MRVKHERNDADAAVESCKASVVFSRLGFQVIRYCTGGLFFHRGCFVGVWHDGRSLETDRWEYAVCHFSSRRTKIRAALALSAVPRPYRLSYRQSFAYRLSRLSRL